LKNIDMVAACSTHGRNKNASKSFTVGNMKAFDPLRDLHIYVKMVLKCILLK